MSSPEPIKVTVRVDVVVEGGTAQPVVRTIETHPNPAGKPRLTFLRVDIPSASTLSPETDYPLYSASGGYLLEASGECLTNGGSFPGLVFAKAYPDPNLDPNNAAYDAPPSDAAVTCPLGNGNWSFSRSQGNSIPGAVPDNVPSGANNNTLIVWFDFGNTNPKYSKESTPFHGILSTNTLLGCATGGATRYATFSGALARFGTVALSWNGVNWFGTPPGMKGSALSLVKTCTDYILVLAGPEIGFTATGQASSNSPFVWCGSGVATPQGQAFSVTITE